MNHHSFSFSFLLVTIFLCCTIETTLSYQLIPQRARSLFQRNKQQVSKRSFRNLDDEETEVTEAYDASRSLHLGVVGLKLKQMAQKRTPTMTLKRKSKPETIVANDINTLRQAILDEQRELKQVRIEDYVQEQTEGIADHQVLQLIKERYDSYSTPGHRKDNSTLAMAIEGGGMRGCVSAGMAAAIASLGLTDAFDAVYGSSAGSVVGAYMISRQMCVDVYVDILPAAKKKFVCKRRLIRSIASNLADVMVSGIKRNNKAPEAVVKSSSSTTSTTSETRTPGMNISYVLDGIMHHSQGLRPLDMENFQENDQKQRLRVVSSTVDEDGNLRSKVFGGQDFFNSTMMQTKHNGDRQGLFACLQASMTVPGATGPPVRLHRAKNKDKVLPCFDAFCFEPVPYRSAVEEGATHVLAMCTRPEGCELKTKPGVYEQGVAPLYFKSHGLPKVAEYFEKGGQQYIYAEDILTLEEGKMSKSSKVSVPPPKIYHGVEQAADQRKEIAERSKGWKKAHLFPMKVASNIPELATLEQDKDAVLEAVRSGYAAAFDILAPVVGLDLDLSGSEASKFVFPRKSEDEQASPISEKDMELEDERVLNTQLHVPGAAIPSFVRVSTDAQDLESTNGGRRRKRERIRSIVLRIVKWKRNNNKQPMPAVASSGLELGQLDASSLSTASPTSEMAETLLKSLPGLNGERALFHHLSKDLRSSVYGGETME
eukprot:CAMPEP_0113620648 /NCGR_PEP_ID=MMETSP0017_2-20120614/10528_1 /TAXON_ID=2856 /ORGANISM="Cylindrotheca closterium" /LENGTH=711 /DNA_ID=CAMNT_0000530329 /DNA_START=271 /DNA_END=2406 /DNA_ORIENTATION=+ /assembly_acc=CAM_ASM_000147